MTWGPVTDSSFPNPGAGVEAIRLANGHWALVYNDLERGRHSLALSLSDDEGATWKWTRHIERHEPGEGSYHYPSMHPGGRRRDPRDLHPRRHARRQPDPARALQRSLDPPGRPGPELTVARQAPAPGSLP